MVADLKIEICEEVERLERELSTLEVTDGDRKAAWPFRPSCYKAEDLDGWLAGTYDNASGVAIRAFALHRVKNSSEEQRQSRTLTDHQRMIWRDDVEGICPTPDMCFEYSDHARCGPCAIKQAVAAGVSPDFSVPNFPEVSRLRREIDTLSRLRAAAKELIDGATRTYKARNGRVMSIQADDGEACDIVHSDLTYALRAALETLGAEETANPSRFQNRVGEWMKQCFTPDVIADRLERSDRFIEEALELVQACGYSADRAHALVEYVFGRAVGEPLQEVGGVMVTLAALCNPHGLDMAAGGETELARISVPEVIEKIRAKQASKPVGSALPVPTP